MLVVAAEQSDRAREKTFNRRKERCAICIHPINAPQTGSLIKQAKRNTLKKVA